MQVKTERTGTDPVEATITMRSHDGAEERIQVVTDEDQATAMINAMEAQSLLGEWRGPGA